MPSPETTALVQRLKRHEFLLRVVDRSVEADNIKDAIAALSQERTCSTCRHLDYADVGRERPVCQHRDSPLRHLGTVRPEAFGCLLWEQADPRERV